MKDWPWGSDLHIEIPQPTTNLYLHMRHAVRSLRASDPTSSFTDVFSSFDVWQRLLPGSGQDRDECRLCHIREPSSKPPDTSQLRIPVLHGSRKQCDGLKENLDRKLSKLSASIDSGFLAPSIDCGYPIPLIDLWCNRRCANNDGSNDGNNSTEETIGQRCCASIDALEQVADTTME